MPALPTLHDVRRTFAATMRTELKQAAGADHVVDPSESVGLRPLLRDAFGDLGGGAHAVNDVMDAVMARASDGWGAVNQKRGPGRAWLSAAELQKLSQSNPDLSAATQTATELLVARRSGVLTDEKLGRKAAAGLLQYVKTSRIHDADWAAYFPTTWTACVDKGVPAAIAAFFTHVDTTVEKKTDSVLYTGRGPFDLYTEIEVAKKDGAVKHVLVEID